MLEGLIGNKCTGVFSLVDPRSPPPPPYSYHCPKFDFYGNGFHAWASHELS